MRKFSLPQISFYFLRLWRLPLTMARSSRQLGSAWEAQFTADALKRGLHVLHPFGDYLPYDLVVQNPKKKNIRVQVKGTQSQMKGKPNTYRITASCGNSTMGRTRMSKEQTDVLAIYVEPCNLWYHIPVEKVNAMAVNLCTNENSTAQYEIWREAWNTYF